MVVDMASMDSAEALTKFLRSKESKIDDIVSVCHDLINDKLAAVYLPNKLMFIFQLLCDRVNDFNSKQFKNWKSSTSVWDLFATVWSRLNHEKLVRNKMFKKVKFVEILTLIFNNHSDDQTLVASIMKTTQIIRNDCYLNIDENSAILLLASYVSHGPIDRQYSLIIKELYQLPISNVSYSLTKKSYTKFISSCCQPILKLCVDQPNEASIFKSILTRLLFTKEMLPHLQSNIKDLLNQLTESTQVKFLFQLVIDNIKEISQCEQLFLLITTSQKFPGLEESLLAMLSKGNKALSYEFFKSFYLQQIEQNTVNWNLICHIFDLDVELAIENSNILYTKLLSSRVDTSVAQKVGKTILNAYVKGRELNEFFTPTWLHAIEEDLLWSHSQFIHIVSQSIDKFSSRQLILLINDLIALKTSNKPILPLFTAIFKGLISSTLLKIEQVKPTILENIDYFIEGSKDSFWEVRYYLLCLFEDEAWIQKLPFKTNNSASRFYYYSMFRMIELGHDEPLNKLDYQDGFIQFVLKNPQLLEIVLTRWTILIEVIFSKENHAKFIKLVFENVSIPKLKEFLAHYGDIFFEQQNLSLQALNYISKNCKENFNLISIIRDFPIQNFNKVSRNSLLDSLYDISTTTKSNEVNLNARLSIMHLITHASSKSRIESDFESMIKLNETSNSICRPITFKICQTIWINTIKQFNNEDNKKIIGDSLDYLQNYFHEFKPRDEIPAILELCLSILSITEETIGLNEEITSKIHSISQSFVTSIHSTMNIFVQTSPLDLKNINWLIWALILTVDKETNNHESTISAIKSLGKAMTNLPNLNQANQVRLSMFQLLCKIYPTQICDAKHILSLYFILESCYELRLYDELVNYLSRLSENDEVFVEVFSFILNSTEDMTKENSKIFVQIITSFMNKLKKTEQEIHSTLFVRSLSIILSKFELLDNESLEPILVSLDSCLSEKMWLFKQYALESTMVLATQVAHSINQRELGSTVYIQTTKVVSSILLFHRYKLSSRHHMIITTFVSLMEPLCLKNHGEMLSSSKESAAAYSRLLSNLCEGSTKELSKNSLSSSSSLIKKAMRKHLPILLINYVYYSLKYNFQSTIQDELTTGIYSILDVLSQTELQLVSSSLDIPGKSYFKSLYSTYKDHGKWKDI
jgi:nucleolar pre-ribosomal-associated protein 2